MEGASCTETSLLHPTLPCPVCSLNGEKRKANVGWDDGRALVLSLHTLTSDAPPIPAPSTRSLQFSLVPCSPGARQEVRAGARAESAQLRCGTLSSRRSPCKSVLAVKQGFSVYSHL